MGVEMVFLSRMVLLMNSVVIGLIGLAYLYDPNLLLANYGLAVDGPGMDNMLRSTYGGLFIALAGVFAFGVLNESRRPDAMGLLALIMGGLALGRVASLVMAGPPEMAINTLLAYEASVFVIALFLYRQTADA